MNALKIQVLIKGENKWMQLSDKKIKSVQPCMRPCRGGASHVAHLNFTTSRVGVYKCLSLIVGFAVTVVIWPREVVSCDFILLAVATFLGHVTCQNLPWQGLCAGVIFPGHLH